MSLAVQLVGAGLLLLALGDVFLTVLYARSGTGLISPLLQKIVWRFFKVLASLHRPSRDTILSYGGPTIMVVTAAVWFVLLLVGIALIAWPALGAEIQASKGATPTTFTAAIYYAGYGLTTLGTGDILPKTGFYRGLMVAQAFMGFSVLTLTLTYFMSVYSALVRRNTLANALHQLSGGTGDAAEILRGLGAGGSLEGAREIVSSLAVRVFDLLESHHSYPVMHYFRFRQPRYAMARVALLTMDTATLARTALGSTHESFSKSGAVEMLWGSGLSLLQETGRTFLASGAEESAASGSERASEARRFEAALPRLEQAGLTVVESDEASRSYVEQRGAWAPLTKAFAKSMAHQWEEIEPASVGALEPR